MKKFFCIKTNEQNVIDYLLNKIEEMNFPNLIYSNLKFKIYENIFIYFRGERLKEFQDFLSLLLCQTIIDLYEEKILNRILNYNYFYFEEYEKKQILQNCFQMMQSEEYTQKGLKEKIIQRQVKEYVKENKAMILDGFIQFRLKEYHQYLDNMVDLAVNQYVIEKEYTEFINLLKVYIDSRPAQRKTLHLIYTGGESILLDEDKNIVTVSDNLLHAKYLSDISFSSNDIALNTLLTLLPEKVEIHLIDTEDEFIKTLKQIFEGKVSVCQDCNICRTYRLLHHAKI